MNIIFAYCGELAVAALLACWGLSLVDFLHMLLFTTQRNGSVIGLKLRKAATSTFFLTAPNF